MAPPDPAPGRRAAAEAFRSVCLLSAFAVIWVVVAITYAAWLGLLG